MYLTIYYGLIYLTSLILVNIDLLRTQPIEWNDNIVSLISIINYLSLFGYLNNFMKMIRRNNINTSLGYKIIFCIYNSFLSLFIICNMSHQISRCITNNCLNNSDYSYDLFGIILEITLISQLLIHLMFPLYKCYTKEQNELVIDKKMTDSINRLKKVYIIFNSLIIYNIFFVGTIPQTSLFAIYYALLMNTIFLTLSFLQLKTIESSFSVNLSIFSIMSIHCATLLNLLIIIFEKNDFIPTSINFGLLLTSCLLSIACMNNIMNTYSKLKFNNESNNENKEALLNKIKVEIDPDINNLIDKYAGYNMIQEGKNPFVEPNNIV